MERFQIAIEKARRQRRGKFRLPDGNPEAAVIPGADAAWPAVGAMVIKPALMRRNRIVTIESGASAAPFDMLRTRVLQQARANKWRRIAVVSMSSASGKSTTVANLAFSLARQQDVRTAVFDFDLRRIGLSDVLGQRVNHTMADVLHRRISFPSHALRFSNNVLFGLNRAPVPNPSELLQSQLTADVLAEIDAIYSPDISLFDMPPLLSSDDNIGFLKNVDCALIVVEAERTTTDQIDKCERQVAELTRVMGLVLNKCRYVDEDYDYGYI